MVPEADKEQPRKNVHMEAVTDSPLQGVFEQSGPEGVGQVKNAQSDAVFPKAATDQFRGENRPERELQLEVKISVAGID